MWVSAVRALRFVMLAWMLVPAACLLVSAEDSEWLLLIDEDRALAISLDGTVSLVARARRFTSLMPQRHAVASEGTVLDINPSPGQDGLHVVSLLPGKTIGEEDFVVTREVRWSGYRPLGMSLSPDGALVCIRAVEVDKTSAFYDQVQLYILDRASHTVRRTTSYKRQDHHTPQQFNWSPDGTRIAYYCAPDAASQDPSSMAYELHVVEVDGEVRTLANPCKRPVDLGAVVTVGPMWSVDGKSVIFVGDYEHGPEEPGQGAPYSYCVPADGGSPQLLCRGTPTSVTPDGKYLFASVDGESPSRLRVELETGEKSECGVEWRHARVSRSGRYVACFPSQGGVVVFESDGKAVVRLTPRQIGIRAEMDRSYWILQK